MRRALRHLGTFCSAASLLLCAVVCVLWVRSSWVYDRALWSHYRREAGGGAAADSVEVSSQKGRLWVTYGWGRLGRPGDLYWDEYYRQADATGGRQRLEIAHYAPDPMDGMFALNAGPDAGKSGWGPVRWQSWGQSLPAVPVAQHNMRVGVSHWVPALLLAVPPAWRGGRRIVRWRRRRTRLGAGLCIACGYDLRGSPGRCPECGEVAGGVGA
jgi:hypothetical protein